MSATAWREQDVTRVPRGEERWILGVALVLTVAMFGWQGRHLVRAHRAASHEQTTTLVEAVHSAGVRQIGLVEDLEHEYLVLQHDLTDPGLRDWTDRYTDAAAATRMATDAALADVGPSLTEPVGMVGTAASELDRHVDRVLEQLSTEPRDQATAAVLDPAYLAAQAELARAVDGQLAGLAADLEARTDAERLDEYHSVAIALALFTAAIGAWAIFGRQLRRSRRLLADEQEQRLEAEAELSQLQKMEALGLMADGVAHDVKNLTVIIAGSAEDVRRGLPDGHPAGAALTRIEDATRQADDMAQALLAFSREDRSPKDAVDLASLAVGMTQLLRYIVPAPIELVVDVPEEAWVDGDAVQLQQVVFNLAANARDAMPGGGTLTVTVRSGTPADGSGPLWVLEVRDTGTGMTPDVVERVFDPFFTTRPAGQGSGLGLALVDRIVEDHRGWIEVTSHPGEGSTFTIGLPARASPRPAPATDERHALVLVAHPVPHLRDLIGGALAAQGFRTLVASTAAEVTGGLDRTPPEVDLAVIDARLLPHPPGDLPGPPDVPVVVTGDVPTGVELDGHRDVCVLGEPLSLAELTGCVATRLRPGDRELTA